MGFSNTDLYDKASTALKDRLSWEGKIARFWLQRHCQDRAEVNNIPFPRASNLRWPLCDTIIEQKKAFFGQLPYSAEQILGMTAMNAANSAYATGCGSYLDFILKQRTNFEEEYLYCIDNLLQTGELYLKITWSKKYQIPVFTSIHPLFIITPWNATRFQDSPWFVHVMQFHKQEFIKRFTRQGDGDKAVTPEQLEELYDSSQGKELQNDQQDTEGKEYQREGISKTADKGKAVVWEYHYKDENGKLRIRTISPDNPDFNFQDDRSYPYWWKTKFISEDGLEVQEQEEEESEWMVEHCRREYIDKKLHSSRGIPEVVAEGEYSLTAMLRAKHNDMVFRNAPVYFAPNGIPGNTQNVDLRPGSLLPFQAEILNQGAPPISWDQEMQSQLRIWEQRVASPNTAIGDTAANKDTRTATESSFIQNITNVAIRQETATVKKFIQRACRQAWRRITQYKPKSLQYYQDTELATLPEQALNDDYIINVNGSAEAVNKEFMLKKAEILWNTSKGNPYANQGEAYKNLLEHVTPGQVYRFYQDPQERQAKQVKKTTTDIAAMIGTGAYMGPDQTDDLVVAAQTAAQYLQKEQARLSDPRIAMEMRGTPQASPQVVQMIGRYIAECREILSHTNKPAYQQLTQWLNQMDLQAKQQQVALQMQAQGVNQGQIIPMQQPPQQAPVQQSQFSQEPLPA